MDGLMILLEMLSTRTNFSVGDNEMEIGRIPVSPEAPIAIRTRIMIFFFMAFASNNRPARNAGRFSHYTKHQRIEMPPIVGRHPLILLC